MFGRRPPRMRAAPYVARRDRRRRGAAERAQRAAGRQPGRSGWRRRTWRYVRRRYRRSRSGHVQSARPHRNDPRPPHRARGEPARRHRPGAGPPRRGGPDRASRSLLAAAPAAWSRWRRARCSRPASSTRRRGTSPARSSSTPATTWTRPPSSASRATTASHFTPTALEAETKEEIADVPRGADGSRSIDRLSHDPRVERVEPLARVRALFAPNDPLLKEQWHMDRIGASRAWDFATGRGVTVAVVDTGIACENYGPFTKGSDLGRHRVRAGVELRHQERARQRRPGPRHARGRDHRAVDQQRHRRGGRSRSTRA